MVQIPRTCYKTHLNYLSAIVTIKYIYKICSVSYTSQKISAVIVIINNVSNPCVRKFSWKTFSNPILLIQFMPHGICYSHFGNGVHNGSIFSTQQVLLIFTKRHLISKGNFGVFKSKTNKNL